MFGSADRGEGRPAGLPSDGHALERRRAMIAATEILARMKVWFPAIDAGPFPA